jgi:hypothetical protein
MTNVNILIKKLIKKTLFINNMLIIFAKNFLENFCRRMLLFNK